MIFLNIYFVVIMGLLTIQHPIICCYFILSLWIFLLIVGMYKFMINTLPDLKAYSKQYETNFTYSLGKTNADGLYSAENRKYCTPIETLIPKEDGGKFDGWYLQGVLLVIRHGDRGPLSHVRDINFVNCGYRNSYLLNKYKSFLSNGTATGGHSMWMKNGAFHGFPLLPPYQRACLLAQLTYKGIAQQLRIGEILKQSYGYKLGISSPKTVFMPRNIFYNVSQQQQRLYDTNEIIVYSTRYRRTFQSAMALLYALVSNDRWSGLALHESHSLAFCFGDCACAKADLLIKQQSEKFSKSFKQDKNIESIANWIAQNILQNPAEQIYPMELRDAILLILCHNGKYPCRCDQTNFIATTTEEAIINIDQDDQLAVDQYGPTPADYNKPSCIDKNQVASLLKFSEKQENREGKHRYFRELGLLRAYGLLRNIVSHMIKIMSDNKTKFVLYSGHDKTIQYLLAALHIKTESHYVSYATRVAFEMYKSTIDLQYYFRFVYNGVDVTRKISFCNGGISLRVRRDSRGRLAYLCPIENIIRFIHDDYFSTLNATNFKDACVI